MQPKALIAVRSLILAVLLAGVLHGQAVRLDPTPVFTTSAQNGSGLNPMLAVAGSLVQVCNSPANGKPCSNFATTYTDGTGTVACPTMQQAVPRGTTTCTQYADAQGNFGFWLAPGAYFYQIQTPTGQLLGPYPISSNGGSSSGVASFNGRVGAVTLNTADVTNLGTLSNSTTGNAATATALLANPSLLAGTGIAITGTWPTLTFTATGTGVSSFNTRTGSVTLSTMDISNLGTLTNATSGNAATATALATPPSLIAGANITITGTWPTLTFNATGGGGLGLPGNILFASTYGTPSTSPTGITAAITACGANPCTLIVPPLYGSEIIPGSQPNFSYPTGSIVPANVNIIDQRTPGNSVLNNAETNIFGNIYAALVNNCNHTTPMLSNNIVCGEYIQNVNDGGVNYNVNGSIGISDPITLVTQQNNATYGQSIAFSAGVNKTGVGDALALSLLSAGHGGQVATTDENLEGFDIGVLQGNADGYVGSLLGTVGATGTGLTTVNVSISQGPSDVNARDQGSGRYMLRTQGVSPSSSAVTGIVNTANSSTPAVYTITGVTTLPVSTTIGTTTANLPAGAVTAVPLTFTTGVIGSITTSTLFCIADPLSSIEYLIPSAVGASTVTLTSMRPHPSGSIFSTGGVCGQFISLTADNATSSTYPTMIRAITGTMKRWWPLISSSATSGSGSGTTQTVQVAIQQQGQWQTQETQWTSGGMTGFSVASGAEVYSVASAGKVGNTWTLSPNAIPWTIGDTFELPHHPAVSATLGQLYIQQETPNAPGSGHAAISYYGAVAGAQTGLWQINNFAPNNSYKGGGGNFDPPLGFNIVGDTGGVLTSQYGGYYSDIQMGCTVLCTDQFHRVLWRSWGTSGFSDGLYLNETTGEWGLTAANGFTGSGPSFLFTLHGFDMPEISNPTAFPTSGRDSLFFNASHQLCILTSAGSITCGGSGGGGGYPLTSGLGVSVTQPSSNYQVNIQATPRNVTATSDNSQATDCGRAVTFSAGASAVAEALGQAGLGGNYVAGCTIAYNNYGTGTVTITPSVSTINNGAGSYALASGSSVTVASNPAATTWDVIAKSAAASGAGTLTSAAGLWPTTLFNASGCNITITSSGTFNCSYATGQTASQVFGTNSSGAVGFYTLPTIIGYTPALGGNTNSTDSSTVAISLTTASTFISQLTTNTTLTIGSPVDGQEITIVAQQNASSANTVTFPASFHGVSPTWSSGWTLGAYNSQTWKWFTSCSCALSVNSMNQ